jgi:type II secretory pathway component PulK
MTQLIIKTNNTMRLQKILILAIAILAFGVIEVSAQKMSRQEKKEFKQKLKEYRNNPDALLSIEDDRNLLRRENQDLQVRLNQLEAERGRKDARIADLEQEIAQLNMGMRSAQDAMQQLREQQQAATMPLQGPDMRGLTFRVQIGAYGKTAVPATLDKADDNFDLETVDGLQRILIGLFRNMDEAEQLRGHMQKIGIKDAWVVPYLDGNRITMEEARPLMDSGM